MPDYCTKSYEVPIGRLYAALRGGRMFALSFSPIIEDVMEDLLSKGSCSLFPPGTAGFREELGRFFRGADPGFRTGIRLHGSDFQRAVWKACMHIPYGETRSYGELAQMLGDKKAARAAGNALSVNPLPLIVPCHRVIAADGSPGGFSAGLKIKKQLLNIEKGEI